MAQAAEEFPLVEEVTLPPTPQRTSPSATEDMTISDLQALRYDTQSKQQSIEAQRLQDQATREQMQKAATPKIAEAQDALKGVEGAAQTIAQQQTPPLPQPPKLQNFLNKDAANMMMAIASVVAGFNSNGRVRGIRANRALAAGINGYVAGNLEVAKLGLEDWKNQMTLQLHENEQIRQKNLDILNASKLTLEAKKQAFDLEMAPYGMKLEGYKANLGYLEKSVELNKEMAQIDTSIIKAIKAADPTLENLKLQSAQLSVQGKQLDIKKKQMELGNQQQVQNLAGLSGEEILKQLSPQDAALVKKVANYEIPISGFGGMDAKTRARILPLVAMYDPSFSASEYQTRMALRRDFTSGKSAQNIRGLNTAIGHLDSLKKAADKLDNSPIQVWNTIANYGLKASGDPRVTNFNNAANAVESELAQVFKGMGASDQEIKAWRENLSASQSPQQLHEGINTLVELLGSRMSALRTQYEQGLGKRADFSILSPKSRQILQKIGIDPQTLDPVESQSSRSQAGGRLITGQIVVRNRATGEMGTLSEKYFDPSKYEKIPEGQPVQAPSIGGGY